ncbi:hypothetical protein [Azospirillum sp.]|uniref:hypothetical protein n=1 Tax=Azospirillum sp. TaxID=34012 RepID=UPI00262F8276|nr:hypothetical protein [Azospirillum sp.]
MNEWVKKADLAKLPECARWHAGFVRDALEQALHQRQPVGKSGLVHSTFPGKLHKSAFKAIGMS